MFTYHASLVRVVDGDTIDLMVDLGFGVHTKIRARIYGVDTPEIVAVKHSSEEYRKGIEAREFVRQWFAAADGHVVIRSHDGKRINSGKYGRWIVEVERPDGGNLSRALLVARHAVEAHY